MRRVFTPIILFALLLQGSLAASCPALPVLDNFLLSSASAQTQAQAILYGADASAFPSVSSFMDVFDASGRFVSGLLPDQVTVLEDGQRLPVESLTEMVVPMQLVVAINPGPALGTRDKLGTERFEQIVTALGSWAQALPPDTPDDMSLVTLSGPIISHAGARDWLVSLQAFRPDFRETTPNLQTLQIAIDTVAVQAPRVGMKRGVFFITPHSEEPDIEALLAPLTQRAIQNGVRVFVWFIDTELYAASPSAVAFTKLAAETGGAYFAATELQPFPDPESYFAPLRRLYGLTYQSASKTGGEHTVSVEVVGQAGSLRSTDQKFTIDLQPPNPIFVAPPLQILRSPPEEDPYSAELLQPVVQPLELIVEFPDGHPRSLVRTTLYVDGQVAYENTTEPFNALVWDLTGYKETGDHKLAAEVVDSLGLSRTSIEVPVTVTVIQPPHGVAAFFGRFRESIIIAAIAFAGMVLLLMLFLGRLRTIFARLRRDRQAQADPLTQSVTAGVEISTVPRDKRGKPRSAGTIRARKGQRTDEAAAFLRPLIPDPLAAPGETFKPASGDPIPLVAHEVTFGTDPKQASHVLDDPSLDAQHARITQTETGDFFVADAGTIGGTWVNFEPVGQEARLLRHGDVLHFGQLAYRFELRQAPKPPPPTITKTTPA